MFWCAQAPLPVCRTCGPVRRYVTLFPLMMGAVDVDSPAMGQARKRSEPPGRPTKLDERRIKIFKSLIRI